MMQYGISLERLGWSWDRLGSLEVSNRRHNLTHHKEQLRRHYDHRDVILASIYKKLKEAQFFWGY